MLVVALGVDHSVVDTGCSVVVAAVVLKAWHSLAVALMAPEGGG